MSMRRRKPKRLRQALLLGLGVLIIAYFFYHTIQGERGWFAMLRLQRETTVAEGTLERLEAERSELEHRTKLLKNDSMDPDMLDEKSRELLNYSKPNEIVIITPLDKEKGK